MKKHLTTLFLFAATVMMTTLFTSCGEEVNIEDPDNPNEEVMTVFSEIPNGTRTTMAANGMFYWQSKIDNNNVRTNDQIWIDEAGTGVSFSLESASSAFESDMHSGRFYFLKALGENTYNLSYTGFGSTTGDEVTIKEEQMQEPDWDNADHIGTSGDCATATATKVTGTSNYTFKLDHKASYLVFQPYVPVSSNTNPYRLTSIEIVDLDNNALCGTFPLKMAGLQTNGATNTAARVRLTCGTGFQLPSTPSKSAYAVILPRGVAEGGRPNLEVRYHVNTAGNVNYVVVEKISGNYEANNFRLLQPNLSMPEFPTVPTFTSDGNGLFGGVKFKPAFLRRTNGNATTGATLELDADPFILLQYNQGAQNAAITEFQKRMYFSWNELVEVFGHVTTQGNGGNYTGSITNTKTIGGKSYSLPTSSEYSKLIETQNSGRATVNYYPASYAAVIVDLSGDATYSTKGWNRTSPSDANVNATHIAGYLFFPDESVILDSKILIASLNGRWGGTASTLTADELRNYINHGCMFLPAAGYISSVWANRGIGGHYWLATPDTPSQSYSLVFNGSSMSIVHNSRSPYFTVVLIEN